ncbi:MAG TPA: methyltransferase domain-containing protein [Candidatus Avimonoglobus intestinipullorum]|uniref:Methyltransferase domain-containing protein n=1 Tax=Candidatus Avimonoglobus intestinipullorum TaxID=2840699 RepID=A0A9D1S5Z3_9FIRM|nr:methyltransferase domain-containing protein [Candidatus Avimonoglobus intestinipullorum]
MNIIWDAQKYTQAFSFVHQYGEDVLELLDLERDMAVLDLGCGNGALTKRLAERGVRAIGLDASAELLETARTHYPDLTFVRDDATAFVLDQPVDAVFSNAVLHWIDRVHQPAVLQHVYAALRDGGQFVFEFGGCGNNRRIHAALEQSFKERGLVYEMPFYFPTIGEYAGLLEQMGFRVTYMTLFDRMTPLQGENGLEEWIRMFVKQPFEDLAEDEKNSLIRRAAALLQSDLLRESVWYADYVRIRGKAVKLCSPGAVHAG